MTRMEEDIITRLSHAPDCMCDAEYTCDRHAALAEIKRLRKLLLTGLAIHGAEAWTHSEKEWREEARAALGINR